VGRGYVQGPITNSLGRVGYFVAKSSDREGLERRAEAAYCRLELRSSDGHNLLFWPPARLVNV